MRRWTGPAAVAVVLLAGCGPVVRDVTVNPSALVAGEPATVCAVVDWDSSHPAPMTWTLEASNNDVVLDRRSGSSDDLPCMTVIPGAPGTVRVEAKARQEGDDGWESSVPVEVPVGDPVGATVAIVVHPFIVTPNPLVPNTTAQVQVPIEWLGVPGCDGAWALEVQPPDSGTPVATAMGTNCDPVAALAFTTGGEDLIGQSYTISLVARYRYANESPSTTVPVVAAPPAVAPAG